MSTIAMNFLYSWGLGGRERKGREGALNKGLARAYLAL